ncbi:hypothetical protein [Chryseobacterium gwangjuense]|uniref:hypothetical protein n=1 Tax=Chryseobacterium gwangjuense TaxID=1069980 RepID=UPI001E28A63B|nr:hypothetical protein [Chryseobacterium gwangjuense]MCE3075451.1 hypothetical protein [Chryseobacterium gwangjuense]
MKFKTLLLALFLVSTASFAQKVKYTDAEEKVMETYYFDAQFPGAGKKKTSIVILKDGSIHKGYFENLKSKKSQIYSISIKDSVTKKPMTFDAENVSELYLYKSSFGKVMMVSKYMSSIRNYQTKKLGDITSKEYVHFVNQTASLKNKQEEQEFLMQLINPEFDKIISVYNDPRAHQTNSFVTMGPVQLGGGVLKSYYVKKGDKVLWLEKSDFDDNYDFLFGDSPEFMAKYPKKSVDWGYFSFLVMKYTEMSAK